MTRWSICFCAVLFAACTDGGPGTESPVMAPTGGTSGGGSGGTMGNPTGGVSGAAGAGGSSGAGAGQAGVGVTGGAGGAGGSAGEAGASAGFGGMGGEMNGDEDGGVDDEGYCTTACTGIGPDDGVAEACSAITEMEACMSFETGGFPSSCRWVTPDSEPCLAP